MAPGIAGHARLLPTGSLRPNDYNPNRMDAEMYAHELASIREFGFVNPIIARYFSDTLWEIIDGEHRWKAAIELGMDQVPVWDLGKVDDETAQQLTIVLNETRGQAEEPRLAALVAQLAQKRSAVQLQAILPFSAERIAELSGQRGQIDFAELQRKRQQAAASEGGERWVERVYRLPLDAAGVIDEAIRKTGIEQDWRALEMIAADYLGS